MRLLLFRKTKKRGQGSIAVLIIKGEERTKSPVLSQARWGRGLPSVSVRSGSVSDGHAPGLATVHRGGARGPASHGYYKVLVSFPRLSM